MQPAQRTEFKLGLNTTSDHCLALRTKSHLQDARDKMHVGTLYKQHLRDTKEVANTNIGIVQGKIPTGQMYQRYLRSRNTDDNHQ